MGPAAHGKFAAGSRTLPSRCAECSRRTTGAAGLSFRCHSRRAARSGRPVRRKRSRRSRRGHRHSTPKHSAEAPTGWCDTAADAASGARPAQYFSGAPIFPQWRRSAAVRDSCAAAAYDATAHRCRPGRPWRRLRPSPWPSAGRSSCFQPCLPMRATAARPFRRPISFFSCAFCASSNASCRCLFSYHEEKLPRCTSMLLRPMDRI